MPLNPHFLSATSVPWLLDILSPLSGQEPGYTATHNATVPFGVNNLF